MSGELVSQSHTDDLDENNDPQNNQSNDDSDEPMNEDVDDIIIEKYILEEKIGEGAYGIVWRALEKETNRIVAVKKVVGGFRNFEDSQRTYREVSFLRQLFGHPNIVQLLDVIESPQNDKDLYLIFEFVDTDLFAMFVSSITIHQDSCRWIMYQLFCVLKYLHSGGLLHRDIKPGNMLLDKNYNLKLCDFGLARTWINNQTKESNNNNNENTNSDKNNNENDNKEMNNELTDGVATLKYRAPELLFGSKKYDGKVDTWAAGCVLAHLFSNKPLFQGKGVKDQIYDIIALTGTPTQVDIDSLKSTDSKTLCDSLNISISSSSSTSSTHTLSPEMQARSTKTMSTLIRGFSGTKKFHSEQSIMSEINPRLRSNFRGMPSDFLSLLERLITFNPEKRFSAEQALSHPFFDSCRNKGMEIICETKLNPLLSDYIGFDIEIYKKSVLNEKLKSIWKSENNVYFFRNSNQKIKSSSSSSLSSGKEDKKTKVNITNKAVKENKIAATTITRPVRSSSVVPTNKKTITPLSRINNITNTSSSSSSSSNHSTQKKSSIATKITPKSTLSPISTTAIAITSPDVNNTTIITTTTNMINPPIKNTTTTTTRIMRPRPSSVNFSTTTRRTTLTNPSKQSPLPPLKTHSSVKNIIEKNSKEIIK